MKCPVGLRDDVGNFSARRLRACILAVIPGDVTEAAVTQCEATMKSKADTSPAAMGKMVEAFAPFGVTKEQIEKRIQRRLDAIQPAQVVSLKKIYASLRDGMSAASDWFETGDAAPASGTDSLDAVREAAAKKRATPAPAKQAASSQQPADADAPTITREQVAAAISKAQNAEALDAAIDLIRAVPDTWNHDDLRKLADKRAAEIQGSEA